LRADLGRFPRPHQRARDDAADADTAQHATCLVRLPQTILIQRIVGPPLKKSLPVPVGGAMAQAAEGARGRRHLPLLVNFVTATRNSSVFIAMMILCSSASSCCFTGVVAAA